MLPIRRRIYLIEDEEAFFNRSDPAYGHIFIGLDLKRSELSDAELESIRDTGRDWSGFEPKEGVVTGLDGNGLRTQRGGDDFVVELFEEGPEARVNFGPIFEWRNYLQGDPTVSLLRPTGEGFLEASPRGNGNFYLRLSEGPDVRWATMFHREDLLLALDWAEQTGAV